ncbi:recombinase family protein [Cellulomonas fimi]|uniref:recombinase family protein n=1 Tax=Cellulomonas fimi TaxID=1708 RepID=UPI00234DA562|nr:recombinase family protein [Cellulomonas fimi]MDC7120271.1 recombinase family protein [Cellulomonas fimi]
MALLGYARVSTTAQDLTRQLDALKAAGIDEAYTYSDKMSGAKASRPGWDAALAYAREGDTIVAYTLDRVGRSVRDTLNAVAHLRERGINLRTIADAIPIDTADDSPMNEMAVLMVAMFAQMERTYTMERTAHARAVAKAQGRSIGRKKALTAAQVAAAVHLRDVEGVPVSVIARDHLHVGRSTLYAALAERDAPTPAS